MCAVPEMSSPRVQVDSLAEKRSRLNEKIECAQFFRRGGVEIVSVPQCPLTPLRCSVFRAEIIWSWSGCGCGGYVVSREKGVMISECLRHAPIP